MLLRLAEPCLVVAVPFGAGPVQYWYLPRAGGLTTPAMWPEPVTTKVTLPPKKDEPR